MQTLQSNVISLFPQPVYIAVDDTLPDVLERVEGFTYTNLAGYNGYNLGKQTLEQDVLDRLPDLKEALMKHIEEYCFGVYGIDPKHHTLEITCSWANCHGHLAKSNEHNHRNSMYSGIVYIKTQADSGDLMFLNNTHDVICPTKAHSTDYNCNQWTLSPVDHMVVIFPSSLVHLVGPNMGTELRYSIAFNIFVKGNFGNPTSLLTL